ncbi:phage portal protein [Primorskyibacter sp. S87]|uniref:phage portal protein n=1 Tax=Primorskyibacter sp. S87 TaxID=3415126 RepID=UPI003C7E42BA
MNWFQYTKYSPPYVNTHNVAIVEACVSINSKVISSLPVRHVRKEKDGTKVEMTSNALDLLNRPNTVQTRTEFISNIVRAMLYRGNGYVASTGGPTPRRAEEIWMLDPSMTTGEIRNGDIWYQTSGPIVDLAADPKLREPMPSREVAHFRLHPNPSNPVVGVTPLEAASSSIMANAAIVQGSGSFFQNQSRPSGVLSTDMELNAEQMKMLREAWNEQSKDLASGGIPILGMGIKFSPMGISAQDAELVSAWKMSTSDICRVFNTPPMMVGELENSTFNNAETLMRFWLSSGLNFLIASLESTFTKFFNLPDDQSIEFVVDELLRMDSKQRIEGLARGVVSGIYSVNDARKREGLSPVDGGDSPMVQSQMRPVDQVDTFGDEPSPIIPSDEMTEDEISEALNDGEAA